MNLKKTTAYISNSVQALVMALLLAVGCLDLVFRQWLLKLGYAGPQPKPGCLRHQETAQKAINKTPATDKEKLLATVMEHCRSHDDDWIDRFRAEIEAIPFSQAAAGCSSDRHLYAVLKPNREENLKRLENVFTQLTKDDLTHVVEGIKKIRNY